MGQAARGSESFLENTHERGKSRTLRGYSTHISHVVEGGVVGVWGLILLFIFLSTSHSLIEVGEASLVVLLPTIGWLIFARLIRDLFYARQLLCAMARDRYALRRLLLDFGLSVSAAAALLPAG